MENMAQASTAGSPTIGKRETQIDQRIEQLLSLVSQSHNISLRIHNVVHRVLPQPQEIGEKEDRPAPQGYVAKLDMIIDSLQSAVDTQNRGLDTVEELI